MSAIAPDRSRLRQTKAPRQKAPAHLDCVRALPCLVCGMEHMTEAAHVRMGDRRYYKRATGAGEKPSDCWTVSLCGQCHRRQHGMKEAAFWREARIDPLKVACLLYAHSGDEATMRQVVVNARQQ